MTWTRIGDNFNDRPDLLETPRSARLLHVEALVYCNDHLRNGALPRGALRRITDSEDPELDAKHLVDAGLWEITETGWQIDWSDQEDSTEVEARKAYRAETQRRYRERVSKHGRGDHSMCDPRRCKAAVTGNATDNVSTHETPSRPVPSRPEDRGQDGTEAGSAGAPPTPAPADDHWPQPQLNAHQFTPGTDDTCSATWDDRRPGRQPTICGSSRDSYRHGHPYLATADENAGCVKCGQLVDHPVHRQVRGAAA